MPYSSAHSFRPEVEVSPEREQRPALRLAEAVLQPLPSELPAESRAGSATALVAPPGAAGRSSEIGYLSRCVVLQAVGAAIIGGLWFAGIAQKPFEGDNGFLCWLIVAMALIGIACVFAQRWRDVQWIATHVVRIGLLGTVIGLIVAFSAARDGGATDPSAVKPMIAAVVSGMYISLYATLLGIGTNLWLKINLRLLGNDHG
jgi:hypothetical protein